MIDPTRACVSPQNFIFLIIHNVSFVILTQGGTIQIFFKMPLYWIDHHLRGEDNSLIYNIIMY